MLPINLRHALRGLLRRPAFTAAAILTLALGIGANTAIFSAVWHLMLAPLPFPDGDRMAWVWSSTDGGFRLVPSRAEAAAFAAEARSLEWVEPHSGSVVAWRAESVAEVLEAGLITHTLPDRLGVRPVIGRSFIEAETAAAGAGVVLVSESFWRTQLGGTASALGSTLRLDGDPYEVIGVMPDRLSEIREHGAARDLWLPLVASEHNRANLLVALAEGITAEAAGAELTAISANVPESRIGSEQPETVVLGSGDGVSPNMRTALFVLLAAVGVVLLIACANVAGLLIIRGDDRRRELAICAALGADRMAILRFLFIETVLIAMAGGAAGLLVSVWGIELIRSIRPPWLSELETVALDPVVIGFAAGITLLTVAVFGVLPALHAARTSLREQFSMTSSGSTGSPQGGRAGSLLVVAEVALAVVLLIGASLLVRSMVELYNEPLGYEVAGALAFTLELPRDRYPDQDSWNAFGQRLEEQLTALPGVAAVSLSTGLPPRLGILFAQIEVEGKPPEGGQQIVSSASVGPDYFRLLGIRLAEGRSFDGSPADANSIIVDRATAERFWPGESTFIGRRLRLGGGEASWLTVVGVTTDFAVNGPASSGSNQPLIFLPHEWSYPFVTVALRVGSGDPLGALGPLRTAMARLDPDMPVRDAATLDRLIAESVGTQRFNMILFASFAVLALVLATVGLYGIVAFTVARRTRELGIRSALGATPQGVRGMVVRQGAILAVAGAAIGVVIALAFTRRMTTMLHDVTPYDPVSFTVAAVLVTAVSILASWIPARRASRVDPMVALREE